jgi:hypothetical protein
MESLDNQAHKDHQDQQDTELREMLDHQATEFQELRDTLDQQAHQDTQAHQEKMPRPTHGENKLFSHNRLG